MLALLRICIGWHFLYEGMWKYNHPEFTADAYLSQARGPFVESYRSLIPDYYGRERLDVKAMTERWQTYLERAADHYAFDQNQRTAADGMLKLREAQLNAYLKPDPTKPQLDAEVAKYLKDIDAWQQQGQERSTGDVPYQKARHWERLQKLKSEIAPRLAEIDAMDSAYKKSVRSLATPEQRQKLGELADDRPLVRKLEALTTYTLIIVGLCLMVGLLTRLNSVAGAAFMLTAVVLPQLAWPDTLPLPHPSAGHSLFVTKEVIEMVALLVLAATAAGRYGGLDFFLNALCGKYCRRKTHAPVD